MNEVEPVDHQRVHQDVPFSLWNMQIPLQNCYEFFYGDKGIKPLTSRGEAAPNTWVKAQRPWNATQNEGTLFKMTRVQWCWQRLLCICITVQHFQDKVLLSWQDKSENLSGQITDPQSLLVLGLSGHGHKKKKKKQPTSTRPSSPKPPAVKQRISCVVATEWTRIHH